MRWLNLIAGLLATLAWGSILYFGIASVGMIVCAGLSDFLIPGALFYNVIVPTVMLTLTIVSVCAAKLIKQPSRMVTWFPIFALASLLIYYGFATGISITDNALHGCIY